MLKVTSFAASVLGAVLLFGTTGIAQNAAPPASLDTDLTPFLQRYDLPAVAAAVTLDGRIVAAGAVGTRRAGTQIPVTLNDRFHIGSDTKAMTAHILAGLVEKGRLRWDSTVGELYPEFVAAMSKGVKDITLEQLLSHRSGIPGDTEAHIPLMNTSVLDDRANLDGMRTSLVRRLVEQPLTAEPGTKFQYSNMGYTLAGAIAERVTGSTWEELVVAGIFEPLRMPTAGFGPQSSLGRVDAPLGHEIDASGKAVAYLAGPMGDNPLVIGPAGTAHMSILDFATWAGWNAMQGRTGPPLLKPETVQKLQTKVVDMPPKPDAPIGTPSTGAYGYGWVISPLPFTTEPFVLHGGSNNINLAYIMLRPEQRYGMVLATNIAGTKANDALIAIAEMLYRRYAPAP